MMVAGVGSEDATVTFENNAKIIKYENYFSLDGKNKKGHYIYIL